MKTSNGFSVLMIMLCLKCGLGGAEKQYGRIFKMLASPATDQHKLLINRTLLELLQAVDILSKNDEPNMIVLDPPFPHTRPKHKSKISKITQSIQEIINVIWYIWQCWAIIHQTKPAIVHPLLSARYICLPLLWLPARPRYVMSDYSTRFAPRSAIHGGIKVKLGAKLKRMAMQHCDIIDALQMGIRDNLQAEGIEAERIEVAPGSFTDLSRCRPAADRKKWVVFLARFVEDKGPLLLAQAISKVIEQTPDVHFYFLGWGELELELRRRLSDSNISKFVTIQFAPQPTEILNQSSIFVSLQTADNYPSQSLLEAMACGNAVIATDVGETWRLVDETNGIRIAPSADALAGAIVSLLQNPRLADYGRASRQRILTEHTSERFFDYITGVYRKVAVGD